MVEFIYDNGQFSARMRDNGLEKLFEGVNYLQEGSTRIGSSSVSGPAVRAPFSDVKAGMGGIGTAKKSENECARVSRVVSGIRTNGVI